MSKLLKGMREEATPFPRFPKRSTAITAEAIMQRPHGGAARCWEQSGAACCRRISRGQLQELRSDPEIRGVSLRKAWPRGVQNCDLQSSGALSPPTV